MYTAQLDNMGPFAIRYPKGRGVMPQWKTPFERFSIGKGRLIKEGKDAAVISIGHIGNYIPEVCEEMGKCGYSVAHYDIRFLKPIDEDLLHEVFKNFSKIITLEDGTVVGGLGSAVLEFMSDHGYSAQVKRLGVPDKFIEQGSVEDLHSECGCNAQGIIQALKQLLAAR
jgi:1-deoxy-D-xylulose-5-phosphate synthase